MVSIGTRTLSESGTVGHWRREQVELFCISKLINCVLESDEEFIVMDFHFATGAPSLLHTHPRCRAAPTPHLRGATSLNLLERSTAAWIHARVRGGRCADAGAVMVERATWQCATVRDIRFGDLVVH